MVTYFISIINLGWKLFKKNDNHIKAWRQWLSNLIFSLLFYEPPLLCTLSTFFLHLGIKTFNMRHMNLILTVFFGFLYLKGMEIYAFIKKFAYIMSLLAFFTKLVKWRCLALMQFNVTLTFLVILICYLK